MLLLLFDGASISSHGIAKRSEGDLTYQSNLSNPRDLYAAHCNPKERFAIIMHGWRETCNADWLQQLIKSKLLPSIHQRLFVVHYPSQSSIHCISIAIETFHCQIQHTTKMNSTFVCLLFFFSFRIRKISGWMHCLYGLWTVCI